MDLWFRIITEEKRLRVFASDELLLIVLLSFFAVYFIDAMPASSFVFKSSYCTWSQIFGSGWSVFDMKLPCYLCSNLDTVVISLLFDDLKFSILSCGSCWGMYTASWLIWLIIALGLRSSWFVNFLLVLWSWLVYVQTELLVLGQQHHKLAVLKFRRSTKEIRLTVR